MYASDDPTQELVAAWGVKEARRLMRSANNPVSVDNREAFFELQIMAAAVNKTDRLHATVNNGGRRSKTCSPPASPR